MPIFEKPPLETLTPAKDRWTPIYLEHGRLEVDDSSIKWIGADRLVYRLPVATLSAILLGPGTTVTHAAMKACADSNTPVCWIGEDGMRFYAFGITPNHDNTKPRHHAALWADKKKRTEIARRMFKMRFPGVDVQTRSINELRGHGRPARPSPIRRARPGVRRYLERAAITISPTGTWQTTSTGRSRRPTRASTPYLRPCAARWATCRRSDSFTRAARCRLSMMWQTSTKRCTSYPAAFQAIRQQPDDRGDLVGELLKERIEEEKLLQKMPQDLEELIQ